MSAAQELPPVDYTSGIRLLARLARVAEQACQATGISLPQYRLLVSVSGRPQRASELAARVGVSRPTLTSLVDGLEQAGLLRRVPVPTDRRGIQLVPTDEGLAAVERADAALIRRMLELVEPEKVAHVGSLIREVVSALDREGEAQIARS
ncbi:MAG: MarR family winged helix-turn-helix transcriptional regulator [Myxococcota bacterium]